MNKKQLIVSTFGFAVWALTFGGPFETLGDDKNLVHLLGSIILALYTLVITIVVKPKKIDKKNN